MPQLIDAADLLARIDGQGCVCMAMMPHLKGAERAVQARADVLEVMVSVSESHKRRTGRASIDQALDEFEPIFALAREADIPVRTTLGTRLRLSLRRRGSGRSSSEGLATPTLAGHHGDSAR